MAYPIEKTGVSSRIQRNTEDAAEGGQVEKGIIVLATDEGFENMPWKEVEAGFRIAFEHALAVFRNEQFKR